MVSPVLLPLSLRFRFGGGPPCAAGGPELLSAGVSTGSRLVTSWEVMSGSSAGWESGGWLVTEAMSDALGGGGMLWDFQVQGTLMWLRTLCTTRSGTGMTSPEKASGNRQGGTGCKKRGFRNEQVTMVGHCVHQSV